MEPTQRPYALLLHILLAAVVLGCVISWLVLLVATSFNAVTIAVGLLVALILTGETMSSA